jgi:sporulation protein YlmC with PRC-barrel domain
MHMTFNRLKHFCIGATDGDIGHVSDAYIDIATWTVRYLVVTTGVWLASRRILLIPLAIKSIDPAGRVLNTVLSQYQIQTSPEINTDEPISRQHESRLSTHYRYPRYWEENGLPGQGAYPSIVPSSLSYRGTSYLDREECDRAAQMDARKAAKAQALEDAPLRTGSKIMNRMVRATDGDLGTVQDACIDTAAWSITDLILDTGNWMNAHRIRVDPRWIQSWSEPGSVLVVNRTRGRLAGTAAYLPEIV